MKRWLHCIAALWLLLHLWTPLLAWAAPYPETEITYTVQPGDTLSALAARYGTSVEAIVAANELPNPDLILVGQRLRIPISTSAEEERTALLVHIVQPGETVSALAHRYGTTVAAIAQANELADPSRIRSGQRLWIPTTIPQPPKRLPEPFTALRVVPLTPKQGQTLTIHLEASRPLTLTGTFDGHALRWIIEDGGDRWRYWALAGVHALAVPGPHPLVVKARDLEGGEWTLSLDVMVQAGEFGTQRIVLPPTASKLLQPELLRRERERLAAIWAESGARPRWQGRFIAPVRPLWPITSRFGTRRTYNGVVSGYHTGVDYGAKRGTLVLAPAAGRAVLAEPLTVRGNAVILDHGAGVHTGYWHLSQILVKEGEEVAQGEPLGRVGNSGLSTGDHLHWELRIGDVAVDPLPWTQEAMPRASCPGCAVSQKEEDGDKGQASPGAGSPPG